MAATPERGGFIERLGDAAAWLFFFAFAITVYEVAQRYLFAAPTDWVHVTSTALCAVGFALGGSYAMARGEHMRVTVLIDRASPRVRVAAEWLALTCGAFYLAGLLWGLVREAQQAVWRFEGAQWIPESTPGPPNWPLPALVKSALVIGAVLFLIVLLRRVRSLVRSMPDADRGAH